MRVNYHNGYQSISLVKVIIELQNINHNRLEDKIIRKALISKRPQIFN